MCCRELSDHSLHFCFQTEIEYQNGTEVPDFSYLEESFLSSFDLAISIVKNFRSLAWLVGTKIYEGISSLWSSSEVRLYKGFLRMGFTVQALPYNPVEILKVTQDLI